MSYTAFMFRVSSLFFASVLLLTGCSFFGWGRNEEGAEPLGHQMSSAIGDTLGSIPIGAISSSMSQQTSTSSSVQPVIPEVSRYFVKELSEEETDFVLVINEWREMMGNINRQIKRMYAVKKGNKVEIDPTLPSLPVMQQQLHALTQAIEIPSQYPAAAGVFREYNLLYAEVVAGLSSAPTEEELARAVAKLNAATELAVRLNKVLEQVKYKP